MNDEDKIIPAWIFPLLWCFALISIQIIYAPHEAFLVGGFVGAILFSGCIVLYESSSNKKTGEWKP